jgi:hypothetical protein
MKKLLFLLLLLPFGLSSQAQYSVNSVYGNHIDCDTLTQGIWIVWWDNDWDYSLDAAELLDSLDGIRNDCLGYLNMQDPPNPTAGYYYNVYLHHGADIFPSAWANGQGTDSNGFPFLTLPIGAHNDFVNVCHEGFHVFQYSANSPGFAYAGDSQWYIEASANWYAGIRNSSFDGAFVEAESLVRLPHVDLWLSFDNFPGTYPNNWQRYVHQYAMAAFLFYLTEEANIPANFITQGLYANTTESPQEYMFNQFGGNGSVFRQHFADYAAHITNDFDFLTAGQGARNLVEWNNYADPVDDNEYTETYTDQGTNGWYTPMDLFATRAWAFNTYKLNNSSDDTYSFHINGDALGSFGDPTFFHGKVVVRNSQGTTFHDLNMTSDQEGSLTLNLSSDDTEVFFIVASMPEVFDAIDQIYSYEMKIEKGTVGVEEHNTGQRTIAARYNLLGEEVHASYVGVQLIHYSDGSVSKELNISK